MSRKLSVIMPVYNEVNTVEQIVKKLLDVELEVERELIIVDDASSDGTQAVLTGLDDGRLRVIHHPHNRGKGAAIRTGLEHATGHWILIQDADLEYNPEDIPLMLEAIMGNDAAAVYGSRFTGSEKNMSLQHRMGNRFLSFATNFLYGSNLSDMETCYKLINSEVIRRFPLRADRFDFEPEITANLLRSGIEIIEVPISYFGREFHEGKKITWRDGFAAIWTLIRVRFERR